MGFILHNDYHIIKTFTTKRGAKIALARKYKAIYPNAIIEDHITISIDSRTASRSLHLFHRRFQSSVITALNYLYF